VGKRRRKEGEWKGGTEGVKGGGNKKGRREARDNKGEKGGVAKGGGSGWSKGGRVRVK